MRVLVTGGRGWIGQATCKALEKRGHLSVMFDRSDSFDVTKYETVERAVHDVDHVIHLAGVLGTHELFANPQAAIDINVGGCLNIIRACLKHDVGMTEITMPDVNPSLYAATKKCALNITEAYRHAEGLRCSYVKAYNAYGPGQAYGGDHPQKIVPTFATKGWAGEPLPVWGDGLLLTDLVHVDDVARMLVEAMSFSDGQMFDAGTGYAQTVLTVAERVIALTGSRSKIDHMDPRKGERSKSTDHDFAHGEGWDLLGGWHPVFDAERFAEAVESYRP